MDGEYDNGAIRILVAWESGAVSANLSVSCILILLEISMRSIWVSERCLQNRPGPHLEAQFVRPCGPALSHERTSVDPHTARDPMNG